MRVFRKPEARRSRRQKKSCPSAKKLHGKATFFSGNTLETLRKQADAALYGACPGAQEQKRCFPIVVISGRDQIHALVAVSGLK